LKSPLVVQKNWASIQWVIVRKPIQLILLNGLPGRSGILLVILDRVIITHCWFFLCIFMMFSSISFKSQKIWGSIVNLRTFVPIFSFLPCMVYPVDVTAYWFFFSWIIKNNFASVYRILTKLGTKMRPYYTTYLCTNFKAIR